MIWLLLTSLTLSQTTLPFISSSAILVCIWFLKAFLFSRPLCLLLPKYQILVFFSPFRSQFKYHFYERLSQTTVSNCSLLHQWAYLFHSSYPSRSSIRTGTSIQAQYGAYCKCSLFYKILTAKDIYKLIVIHVVTISSLSFSLIYIFCIFFRQYFTYLYIKISQLFTYYF